MSCKLGCMIGSGYTKSPLVIACRSAPYAWQQAKSSKFALLYIHPSATQHFCPGKEYTIEAGQMNAYSSNQNEAGILYHLLKK